MFLLVITFYCDFIKREEPGSISYQIFEFFSEIVHFGPSQQENPIFQVFDSSLGTFHVSPSKGEQIFLRKKFKKGKTLFVIFWVLFVCKFTCHSIKGNNPISFFQIFDFLLRNCTCQFMERGNPILLFLGILLLSGKVHILVHRKGKDPTLHF